MVHHHAGNIETAESRGADAGEPLGDLLPETVVLDRLEGDGVLKMLDLDSSLEARKELAQELGVNAGAHGSAEQNIALHKAVMRKLAENGLAGLTWLDTRNAESARGGEVADDLLQRAALASPDRETDVCFLPRRSR